MPGLPDGTLPYLAVRLPAMGFVLARKPARPVSRHPVTHHLLPSAFPLSCGTLLLNLQVPTPAKRDLSMVYLEAFRHSTIVVRVELLVGQGALSPDAVALEDPEATTGALPPGPARVALLVACRCGSTVLFARSFGAEQLWYQFLEMRQVVVVLA